MLVTGASGQLGSAFRRALGVGLFPERVALDLSQPALLVAALADMHPAAIVNCGAYTAVDRAEDEEELATGVNGVAVGVMASYAARRRIPFVTFSSDYVFAGDASIPYVESSPTGPVNAYGRSKLAGEVVALDEYPAALVVRTSWLLSATHPNFVATVLRAASERMLDVVDDQRGCPTMVDDLVPAVLAAIRSDVSGVLHLTNGGEATWFEIAQAALALAGKSRDRVRPCSTSEYPTRARRPAYSVLGSERRRDLGIPELPHWRESLLAVVAGLVS